LLFVAHARTATLTFPSAVFGGAFAASGYFIQTNQEVRGFRFAAINSASLAAVMGYRFYRGRKVMPAGLLAGLGVASAVYHGVKYQEWSE
jgi:uncharacterized membrane protein (UPF0136 family)